MPFGLRRLPDRRCGPGEQKTGSDISTYGPVEGFYRAIVDRVGLDDTGVTEDGVWHPAETLHARLDECVRGGE